ncbi:MAG: glycerate kinase, partial [Clostridia bacterium]|nr:glycerate kinase [Clostridia bacterium]
PGRGKDLERVKTIDVSGLDPRVKEAAFTVMCDVTNPLCGEHGATRTFGPQKGAGPEAVERLEAGMVNYRDVIRAQFGVDPDAIPGSGAAGGLGAALLVFLGAKLQSGITTVLDLIGFDDLLAGADLVITGEGRTDWQSAFGKVLQGVGERCKAKGVPAVALVGSLGKDYEKIYNCGIQSLLTTVDGCIPLSEAMERAEELYYRGAVRLFRFFL